MPVGIWDLLTYFQQGQALVEEKKLLNCEILPPANRGHRADASRSVLRDVGEEHQSIPTLDGSIGRWNV